MQSLQCKLPKLPTIELKIVHMDEDNDIFASKANCIPYIPKDKEYPMYKNQDKICFLQLNMDHIFGWLKNKQSDEVIE